MNLQNSRQGLFEYLSRNKLPTPHNIVNPSPYGKPVQHECPCDMSVMDSDTISAAWNAHSKSDGKIAILNFASFRHPGGGFMTNAMAQEESICHHTNLYDALVSEQSWYEENERIVNRCLYQNRSILTLDVSIVAKGIGQLVPPEEVFRADFLTCAAPNAGVAKGKGVSDEEINRAIEERALYTLKILASRDYSYVILGAFGCGVFRCDPRVVAGAYQNHLTGDLANAFEHVIFAVPNQRSNNFRVFNEVFG